MSDEEVWFLTVRNETDDHPHLMGEQCRSCGRRVCLGPAVERTSGGCHR